MRVRVWYFVVLVQVRFRAWGQVLPKIEEKSCVSLFYLQHRVTFACHWQTEAWFFILGKRFMSMRVFAKVEEQGFVRMLVFRFSIHTPREAVYLYTAVKYLHKDWFWAR